MLAQLPYVSQNKREVASSISLFVVRFDRAGNGTVFFFLHIGVAAVAIAARASSLPCPATCYVHFSKIGSRTGVRRRKFTLR